MTSASFHRFMVDPNTPALLDRLLAHNREIDAAIQADADELDETIVPPLPEGPRQCCADFAMVVECDGEIDLIECWVCGYRYEAPCR